MSSDFEKLKEIGVQKIHETTHISRAHINGILEENFDTINSVQFFGFISIFEREYRLDLSELKAKAKEFFEKKATIQHNNKVDLFSTQKRESDKKWIYVFMAIVVIASVVLIIFNSTSGSVSKIDNDSIENAKKNIKTKQDAQVQNSVSIEAQKADTNQNINILAEDLNATNPVPVASIKSVEKNSTVSVQVQTPAPAISTKSLKITPKGKVWFGYIDMESGEKNQKTLNDKMELDPAKNWLLLFGNGFLDIEINGEIKKYSNVKAIKFSYINSELKEITNDELKALNKGRGW